MGRTTGRAPEDTRRLVLAAAATVFRLHGISATLQDVAREAGVSKGGLLYHFASKDDLVRELAGHLTDRFREEVHARLEPGDPGPGRLTRAYVHACLDQIGDPTELLDEVVLGSHLQTDPQVAAHFRADAERWQADLRADGLPDGVVTLVTSAADGASTAPLWAATLDPEAREALRATLVALTRSPGRLDAVLDPGAGS